MNLHLPHPRRTARARRAAMERRIAVAVARAHLADRTQQTWDWAAELERRRGAR
jgi:hypothetical protein